MTALALEQRNLHPPARTGEAGEWILAPGLAFGTQEGAGAGPQSLYGIADSPLALAAWLLDHNDADGQPAAAVVAALDRTTSATGEGVLR